MEPKGPQIATPSSDSQALFFDRPAIEEQEFTIAQSDADHFFRVDDNLHLEFGKLSRREAVQLVISDAWWHNDRMSRQDADLSDLTGGQHQIVAGIKFGDTSAACQLMIVHLHRVMLDLDRLAAKCQDYSERPDEGGVQTVRNEWRR